MKTTDAPVCEYEWKKSKCQITKTDNLKSSIQEKRILGF